MIKADPFFKDSAVPFRAPGVTALLQLAQDPANQWAREDLYRLIEVELRRIAHARHAEQPQARSFCTTELVHEAWVRLLGRGAPSGEPRWKDRRHFFATASLVVQNLLVDHYRKLVNRPRLVEGDRLHRLPERAEAPGGALDQAERFLALHEALERLQRSDPNAAEVCRLRCFGKLLPLLGRDSPAQDTDPAPQGMKLQEMADHLGIPLSTVHSRWKRAVLFLSRQLQGFAPEGPPQGTES
jgi:RNA polymerase sigma factor (TIGR02999 family)